MAAFEKYRSVYTHDELMERLRRIRHVALDMDGTIYMGMSLFPYTKPFLAGLKEMGIGYSFLTNNPSKSIADYLHKLDVAAKADPQPHITADSIEVLGALIREAHSK